MPAKGKAITRGPTSDTVAANIKRIRKARSLTTGDLCERLSEVGRPILATGITSIETGRRRVDVDDLMALAIALNVNPDALLFPHEADGLIALTGGSAEAARAWDWADGLRPLHDDDSETYVNFMQEARPRGRRTWDQLGSLTWDQLRRGERDEEQGHDDGER